jgi:hypothetical protein
MTKDEALKLALKALRFAGDDGYQNEVSQQAITAIKQARSAPVQEPVYHLRQFGDVTKEQLDRYMATGDINPQPAPVCPACESIEWERQPCQICQPAPVQEPVAFFCPSH